MTEPCCGYEVFRFAACSVNVGQVRNLVDCGKITPQRGRVSIEHWAEKVLMLRRDAPDARPMSMLIHINHDHVAGMSMARLEDEVYVVETRYGSLVVDGNHRVARGYLDGLTDLPAYFFKGELAAQIVEYADVHPALGRRQIEGAQRQRKPQATFGKGRPGA